MPHYFGSIFYHVLHSGLCKHTWSYCLLPPPFQELAANLPIMAGQRFWCVPDLLCSDYIVR